MKRKVFLILAAVLSVTAINESASIQTKSPQHKTTVEQNKAIVRGYLKELINENNLSAVETYLDSGVIFNGSTGFKQRLAEMNKSMRGAFPDLRVTLEDQIGEGDRVATRVTFHGTHKGEFRGIPPSGKSVSYSGIAIDKIRAGKIVEMWHEANTLSLLQQIGIRVLPADSKYSQASDAMVELTQLEKAWNEAHVKGDGDVLDRLWAADFVVTVPNMKPMTKADVIGIWRSGRMKFERYETSDILIRVYDDGAVVTGQLQRTRVLSSQRVDDDWQFTKTYIRKSGRWEVVAFHASVAP